MTDKDYWSEYEDDTYEYIPWKTPIKVRIKSFIKLLPCHFGLHDLEVQKNERTAGLTVTRCKRFCKRKDTFAI